MKGIIILIVVVVVVMHISGVFRYEVRVMMEIILHDEIKDHPLGNNKNKTSNNNQFNEDGDDEEEETTLEDDDDEEENYDISRNRHSFPPLVRSTSLDGVILYA